MIHITAAQQRQLQTDAAVIASTSKTVAALVAFQKASKAAAPATKRELWKQLVAARAEEKRVNHAARTRIVRRDAQARQEARAAQQSKAAAEAAAKAQAKARADAIYDASPVGRATRKERGCYHPGPCVSVPHGCGRCGDLPCNYGDCIYCTGGGYWANVAQSERNAK
jgi:hypothetical protein